MRIVGKEFCRPWQQVGFTSGVQAYCWQGVLQGMAAAGLLLQVHRTVQAAQAMQAAQAKASQAAQGPSKALKRTKGRSKDAHRT